MKLIIDIPKGTYEAVRVGTINQVLEYKVWNAIKNGTSLDEVKAEIEKLSNANPSYWHSGDMVEREEVLEILDNIGRGDSE